MEKVTRKTTKRKAQTELQLSAFEWSEQQIAVFETLARTDSNLVVVARAGTGKTTTIVEAAKREAARGRTVLLLAFNKEIGTELGKRIGNVPGIDTSTLNAFGFKSLLELYGTSKRDWTPTKARTLRLRERVQSPIPLVGKARAEFRKLISLCKAYLVSSAEQIAVVAFQYKLFDGLREQPNASDRELRALLHGTPADIAAATKILTPRSEGRYRDLLNEAVSVLELSRKLDGSWDFDDQIWQPLVLHAQLPQFDTVFVDEAQDLTAAQVELAVRACKGRVVAVGDDRQAMYQFRGAQSNSIDRIVERLRASILPLTVTRRCPKLVVGEAQELVPDFRAAPEAPTGDVNHCSIQDLLDLVGPGDFVLSRTNAPLSQLFVRMLGNGIAAKLMKGAGSVHKQIVDIIGTGKARKSGGLNLGFCNLDGGRPVREVLGSLNRYSTGSEEEDDDAGPEEVSECIRALCYGLNTVDDLRVRVARAFSEDVTSRATILSTTHRAKGLETNHVFVLRDTYLRRQSREEENLLYVAVTRAKRRLTLVEGLP